MIYVLNSKGKPLMPTHRKGKVKHLLRDGKAFIVNYNPFTIQLTKERSNAVQKITLGIDPGYNNIGVSVTTKDKVLFEANVNIASNTSKRLSERASLRRNRRNKKTRSREARFDNRNRRDGWLPPSVQSRIDKHLNIIAKLHEFLPIGKIVVEIANFDIQKIKNPDIKGVEYQHGEQFGFFNVREFVLHRDGHICRCCKGKSGDKILNVHHIESRQTGGDAPNNLITLCKTCHEKFHKGLLSLDGVERGKSYKANTFMNLLRNHLFKKLKDKYEDVEYTYGYITKAVRIENNLGKDHYIDARCISGNPLAKPNDVYQIKKIRCHNRQLHTPKYNKNGIREKRNSPFVANGFRLYDKVEATSKYRGVVSVKRGFITSKISGGKIMELKDINGEYIGRYNWKSLKLLEKRKNFVFEKVDLDHK